MDTSGKKMLGTVPGAENLLATTDNRWFVSGKDGFYQIDPDGVVLPRKIPIAFDPDAGPSTGKPAFFLGITQYRNFVYASCTPDQTRASSPRYIMFMDITQSPPAMVAIHQIFNPGFFNGLAADAAGDLYLTDIGETFPPRPGRIMKLYMASPRTVARQLEWLKVEGHPNGLKIDGDTLYFSEEPLYLVGKSLVRKVRIGPDGRAELPQTIYAADVLRLLDDIDLVDEGLLVTQAGLIDSIKPEWFHHSRFNKIIHISENGQELHGSQMPLSPPSAVKLVPGSASPSPDLIITERTGEVSRFSQEWGLRPRH